MSDIRQKGKDNTNKYTIPDDLFLSKDTILEQLKILENLFPLNPNPQKKSKTIDTPSSTNNEQTKILTTNKITAAQLQNSIRETLAKVSAAL